MAQKNSAVYKTTDNITFLNYDFLKIPSESFDVHIYIGKVRYGFSKPAMGRCELFENSDV